MKKVLLINNCYPTILYPNRSTYIRSIEDALIRAGVSVEKIILISNHSSFWEKIINYFNFYWKLLVFSNYKNYDYIYIHHFPFSFVSLIPHFSIMKKVVINWHGEDLLPTSFFNKILCTLSYTFIKVDYKHIVPSEYFKKILADKLKINPDRILVSPSGGIDMKLFAPSIKEKKQKVVNIGFASGLAKSKGIEYLLYAIENQEKLPFKTAFHIINYGKDQQKYLSKISNIKNVLLHSIYKKENMPQFYSEIDVLAFPTKKESLGLVALEAMSCGVPVVGPAHFALKNIIQSGRNGEAYDNFTYEDFFEALKKCMNNLDHYTSRETVLNQYSKEHVINKFKDIFK